MTSRIYRQCNLVFHSNQLRMSRSHNLHLPEPHLLNSIRTTAIPAPPEFLAG